MSFVAVTAVVVILLSIFVSVAGEEHPHDCTGWLMVTDINQQTKSNGSHMAAI